MNELIAVGFKLPKTDAETLRRELEGEGLTQSKFFRACVTKFLGENRDEFLKVLGFEKRFYWE